MVEIVNGGNVAFNALLFGAPDPNLAAHLGQQFNQGMQNLTDMGQRLFHQSRDLFERFSGDQAMRYIRAIGRAANAVWQSDTIRPITCIGEMQFATPTMQRWIMAEPTVRKMYHEQRLDGYSHSYVDVEPDRIGTRHYDYRRVTNGLMLFSEFDDPQKPEWSATTYFEEPYEGDIELSLPEKADIMHTWECLRSMVRNGREDPTDRFNATLD